MKKHLEKDETKALEANVNELKDGLGKTAMGALRLTGTMANIVGPRVVDQAKKLGGKIINISSKKGVEMQEKTKNAYHEKVVPLVKESSEKIGQGYHTMVGNF